jgi:hypothetical protein
MLTTTLFFNFILYNEEGLIIDVTILIKTRSQLAVKRKKAFINYY